MPAMSKFNTFTKNLAEKVHNLGSDTLKVVLTNTAPVATNTTLANITQIASGNGYTTNGTAAGLGSSTQTSGTYKLVLNDVVFTASGGSMGPFRYAVLYNSTSAGTELIGWFDYGASITLASGENFTVDFDGSLGVFTIG